MTGEADIVAELYARNKDRAPGPGTLRGLEQTFGQKTGIPPTGIAFENQLNLSINQEKSYCCIKSLITSCIVC